MYAYSVRVYDGKDNILKSVKLIFYFEFSGIWHALRSIWHVCPYPNLPLLN